MKNITVIIPTYNSAKYLPTSIESVLNQTYKDFELIIIDDGSTDDTQKISENYKDRIVYIYQENQGPSKARNAGIMAKDSRYIAFLDADDIWLPEKLGMQIEYMNSNPAFGLIFSDAELFEDGGISKGSFWKLRGCYNEMIREYKMIRNPFSKLMEKNFIMPSTALLKRECFKKAGLFDESFRYPVAEDKDMWLRIAMHFSMSCVPYPLIKRRVHTYSPKLVKEITTSVIYVIKKMEKQYPQYIEKEKVNTRKILGPLYYSLGRTYLDQDELNKARENFLSSIQNSFTLKSLFFLMFSLFDIRIISYLRRFKNILLQLKNSV